MMKTTPPLRKAACGILHAALLLALGVPGHAHTVTVTVTIPDDVWQKAVTYYGGDEARLAPFLASKVQAVVTNAARDLDRRVLEQAPAVWEQGETARRELDALIRRHAPPAPTGAPLERTPSPPLPPWPAPAPPAPGP